MNLPNKLTILRISLTFVFMFSLFLFEGIVARIASLLIFSIACLTDFLDGFIARKKDLVTNFGKLMDPIADKLLVIGAFIAFVELGIVSAWMVILIIGREMIITGLRILAATKGKFLAAEKGGKHKTVWQMAAIFLILGYLIFKEVSINLSFWNAKVELWCEVGIFTFMMITVALTLSSGISYLLRNRRLIHE